ncbi:MAG: DnaJ C-terminal domain-containing protein [Paenibacillaceae bacterium]
MKAKNYYEILGISKKATQPEIKKAYKKLAKQLHPDVNKASDAEAKFKEVGEAYEILSHDEKRKEYDEEVEYGSRRQTSTQGDDWQSAFAGGRNQGFRQGAGMSEEDIFGMFFGNKGGGFRSEAQDNIQAQLEITLEQAYKGEKLRVQVGGKPMDISIPARSKEGTVIRLTGKGSNPNGLDHGSDLLIVLHIVPHEIYQENDGNLNSVLQIAPWQAVLGGEAKVTLPDGHALNLKIPIGTKTGKKLRIPGKGLKRDNGSYGDILFEIELVVPEQSSSSEKELYRKLAEMSNFRACTKKTTHTDTRRREAMYHH